MSLIRWEPLRELDLLQKEMNRLFEQFTPSHEKPLFDSSLIPAVEFNETDNAIDLKVEIPGMAPEDISIEVTADSVAITGERKSETKTEENGSTRSEFRYGKYQRIIPLPMPVQNVEAKADYKDGILSLHLPKDEVAKTRVVKVPIS